jgi:hypothetical protein
MKKRRVPILLMVLALLILGLGIVFLKKAHGAKVCGFVQTDCITGKIPISLIPNLSGTPPVYLTPANPTNLTSTSYLMFGLGNTLTITPTKSGKVRFDISFYPSGVGNVRQNNYQLSYGTGVAPANGTSVTGTVVGGVYSGGVVAVAIDAGVVTPSPIVRDVIVVSLTPNTAYWFDIQGAKGSGNTSVGMTTIEATLEELPY